MLGPKAPLALRLITSGARSSLPAGGFSTLTSILDFQPSLLASPRDSCSATTELVTCAEAHLGGGVRPCVSRRQQLHLHHLSRSNSGLFGRAYATTSKADEFNVISVEVGLARIDGYDATGFIVNDVQVEGPIMCYGDLVTLWRPPPRFADLAMDSLALLDLLKPVPALVVVGCGETIRPLPPAVLAGLRERGMDVEVLDTVNAVATFNILNQEGRKVVGALLPLTAG